jgi:hypothetical protein
MDRSKLLVGAATLNANGVMSDERPDIRNPTSKLMLTVLAGVATCEREISSVTRRRGDRYPDDCRTDGKNGVGAYCCRRR